MQSGAGIGTFAFFSPKITPNIFCFFVLREKGGRGWEGRTGYIPDRLNREDSTSALFFDSPFIFPLCAVGELFSAMREAENSAAGGKGPGLKALLLICCIQGPEGPCSLRTRCAPTERKGSNIWIASIPSATADSMFGYSRWLLRKCGFKRGERCGRGRPHYSRSGARRYTFSCMVVNRKGRGRLFFCSPVERVSALRWFRVLTSIHSRGH